MADPPVNAFLRQQGAELVVPLALGVAVDQRVELAILAGLALRAADRPTSIGILLHLLDETEDRSIRGWPRTLDALLAVTAAHQQRVQPHTWNTLLAFVHRCDAYVDEFGQQRQPDEGRYGANVSPK